MHYQIRKRPSQKTVCTESCYVDLASLPLWYHKTKKYIWCVAQCMTGFQVPYTCVYFRNNIYCNDDLKCMLRSMVFWGFDFDNDDTPTSIYEYCCSSSVEFANITDVFVRYMYSELPELKNKRVMVEIFASVSFMCGIRGTSVEAKEVRYYHKNTLNAIMKAGVPLIRFLDATFKTIRGGKQIWMIAAAKFGKVDRVQCLVELGYPITRAAIQIAEKHKHPECAEYLRIADPSQI